LCGKDLYTFLHNNCPSVVVISITTNIFDTNKFNRFKIQEAKLSVKSMLDM